MTQQTVKVHPALSRSWLVSIKDIGGLHRQVHRIFTGFSESTQIEEDRVSIAARRLNDHIADGGISSTRELAATRLDGSKDLRQIRRAHLLSKYRDEQIVDHIVNREIWQGQSQDQLRDSIGAPMDTDEKVTKKYRREVWKYHQTGMNRFGFRVTLENGAVIGWDEKI